MGNWLGPGRRTSVASFFKAEEVAAHTTRHGTHSPIDHDGPVALEVLRGDKWVEIGIFGSQSEAGEALDEQIVEGARSSHLRLRPLGRHHDRIAVSREELSASQGVDRFLRSALMILGMVALVPFAVVTSRIRAFRRPLKDQMEFRIPRSFIEWRRGVGDEPRYLAWFGGALLAVASMICVLAVR